MNDPAETDSLDPCIPRYVNNKCQRCGAILRIGNSKIVCGPCELYYDQMDARLRGKVFVACGDTTGRKYAKPAKTK